ncbi:hypothetical protein [Flavitalea sp.]|nr:hypothetical protein [Flavitalea sp.]
MKNTNDLENNNPVTETIIDALVHPKLYAYKPGGDEDIPAGVEDDDMGEGSDDDAITLSDDDSGDDEDLDYDGTPVPTEEELEEDNFSADDI